MGRINVTSVFLWGESPNGKGAFKGGWQPTQGCGRGVAISQNLFCCVTLPVAIACGSRRARGLRLVRGSQKESGAAAHFYCGSPALPHSTWASHGPALKMSMRRQRLFQLYYQRYWKLWLQAKRKSNWQRWNAQLRTCVQTSLCVCVSLNVFICMSHLT